MKKALTVLPLLILTFCFFGYTSVRAEMTGRQVMEKQRELHEVVSEYQEQTMLLINRSEQKETRDIRLYRKKTENDLYNTLIVFDTPKNIRGLAMLTWENERRQDDQWLYLPSLKKLQRIAEGNKKGYFAGTDFTYEDLETEDLDDFTYTSTGAERIDDRMCYVIEAVPIDESARKNSGYKRRVFWIDKEIFLTVQVHFFNHRDQHVKTLNCHDLVNLKDGIWRADKIVMDNHKMNHKTVSLVKKRDIQTPIGEIIFQQRYITSERHIR